MDASFHLAPLVLLAPAVFVAVGALVDEAARRANVSHKELAIAQGISPSVWTRQCQGVAGHHLALDRIVTACPPAFVAELLGLIAQAHNFELQQVFRLGVRS